MNEVAVFAGIEAVLLAALPVAFLITRLLVKHTPQHICKLVAGLVAFLTVVVTSSFFGLSMRWLEADIFVLFVASAAYSSVFLFAFRIKPITVRLVTVVILGFPIFFGYMAGTVGILGVAFITGDLGSSVELNTESGLLCRAEPFGNATTDVNGYFTRLVRPLGVVEREMFEKRFIDPITPVEACSRASAEYGS
jgi:hypothetical protein